ncbi:MAG: hypothetical protein FWH03_00435 [Firmicutes bacterium]|nr:hypothetical protein [Bacillota bacterium]
MNSWREGVSEEAQNDFDEMFSFGLQTAEHFLNKSKEFYPFANCISKTGEIKPVMAYDGNENPLSNDVIKSLEKGFIATRNEIRATAIVFDGKINTGESAVCFSLEHEQGIAIQILVPYELKGLFKKTAIFKIERTSTSLSKQIIWNK